MSASIYVHLKSLINKHSNISPTEHKPAKPCLLYESPDNKQKPCSVVSIFIGQWMLFHDNVILWRWYLYICIYGVVWCRLAKYIIDRELRWTSANAWGTQQIKSEITLPVLSYGLGVLTHWSRDKMAAVWPTTFSNVFYWMKMKECRLKFHWSMLLRVQLTIFQHWFR